MYQDTLYDLTDYVWTQDLSPANVNTYNFLDSNIVSYFKQRSGQNVTSVLQPVLQHEQDDTRFADELPKQLFQGQDGGFQEDGKMSGTAVYAVHGLGYPGSEYGSEV